MRQKGWFKLDTRKVISFAASVEVHGTTLYSLREVGARYQVVIQTSDDYRLSTRG